ncbi:hypothetical protein A2U01_0050301, partial [Trifolium medium]|nr:hypothetical protein [Trifolium medium]
SHKFSQSNKAYPHSSSSSSIILPPLLLIIKLAGVPEVEGKNVTDAEPVQNVTECELEGQDEPEVEVQNEPEVKGQVSDAEIEVDGDSDAKNATLDAAFVWHNYDGGEVQENIIHENVTHSSSEEEWNSYHSEQLKSHI